MTNRTEMLECPTCTAFRVWSKRKEGFYCPFCDWTEPQREARRRRIDAAIRNYNNNN